ncbi:MAG: HhH-GPD family protein [Deltaproteobacteria bacterium]|jgi:A/G-specific adenine glycosylase|nr:HhH-GPD family protein [Deltaproteobacteria bacterium]
MKDVTLSTDEIRAFRQKIYDYYSLNRRNLPWRQTTNAYNIVVSEMMLQQTQVERVKDKYRGFIEAFPDFHALAMAPLKEVLSVWQGLGYNRRALALKQCAEEAISSYGGELPQDLEGLCKLPGIGRATAGEILAFAFNVPTVFIETNIRRVFIHEFFDGEDNVMDKKILPLVEATLDRENPREWYWALMDYGSMLKKKVVNPNRRSAHYARQSAFEGSDRRIRGIILRTLLKKAYVTEKELLCDVSIDQGRLTGILGKMAEDGLIREKDGLYSID